MPIRPACSSKALPGKNLNSRAAARSPSLRSPALPRILKISWNKRRSCVRPGCTSRLPMPTRRGSRAPWLADPRHGDHAGKAVPARAVPDLVERAERGVPVWLEQAEPLDAAVQRFIPSAARRGLEVRRADVARAHEARLQPPPQALRLRLAAELVERDQHAAQVII